MTKKKSKAKKLRKSAQGEDCTLNISGVCSYRHETVVLCHVSFRDGSKGTGMKTDDLSAVYGCHDCHQAIDGGVDWHGGQFEQEDYWYYIGRGVSRTHQRMVEKGALILA